MRTYFFSPLVSSTELNENYKLILEILQKSGVFVVAAQDEHNTNFKKEELERMNESGEILLDKMDCVVIEASQPDQEIGYLLAYAISQKKPLLYLYKKGTPEKVARGYLTKKNTPEFIKMCAYTRNSIEPQILEFINSISNGQGVKEKPNIKFTLRITPRIERYLLWKSKRHNKTKADYLRELLEEIIGKDEEFKKKM